MKKLTLILLLIASTLVVNAQKRNGKEKIEAARIAMITKKLGLSPDQAEKFWPLYNEYKEKRKDIRKEFNNKRKDFDASNASEEQRKSMLKLGHNFKQRQLDLERKYSDRLLNVISSKQALQLRRSEEQFRQMLLKKLQERRDMQGERMKDRENMRKKREEMMNRKRRNG